MKWSLELYCKNGHYISYLPRTVYLSYVLGVPIIGIIHKQRCALYNCRVSLVNGSSISILNLLWYLIRFPFRTRATIIRCFYSKKVIFFRLFCKYLVLNQMMKIECSIEPLELPIIETLRKRMFAW